jgi:hypothetical protein
LIEADPPQLSREPTVVGPVGRAWRWRPTVQSTPDPNLQVQVASWLVWGPFHPFWNFWRVSCISLEEAEGVPAAQLAYPEAEYEFVIVSLDPEHIPDPDGPYRPLMPLDCVRQFHGTTREQAAEITRLAVRAMIYGERSPDSDHCAEWEDAIDASAAHARGELHG